jgi:sRNA-binding protein
MSKEKQENDHPAALGMIEELCQRYPKTFTQKPHDVRPLARGIREAIVADAPDLPASIVSQVLAIYATWLPYLRACIAGAPRIDLGGKVVDVVTDKEATYAVQRLAARERKRAARNAERETAVRKAQEAGSLSSERPRQAAGCGAQSAKAKAIAVRRVTAKNEVAAVERVAAEAETATVGQVTAKQEPAKGGTERLGLAGLKAAAQRRRLAAATGPA